MTTTHGGCNFGEPRRGDDPAIDAALDAVIGFDAWELRQALTDQTDALIKFASITDDPVIARLANAVAARDRGFTKGHVCCACGGRGLRR